MGHKEMDDGELLLKQKGSLEAALSNAECDAGTLMSYLGLLRQINRRYTGLLDFRWHDVPYPLYFRCGSTDLDNFVQIFGHREYDFAIPFRPRRILDLGAYVGYAAVFLALRFPESDIFCVEPSAANYRMLVLNTSAYPNIRHIESAVWSESGDLRFDRHTPGDWGMRLVDARTEDHKVVAALSLPDVLDRAGWDSVDFLKCDIEGAELKVFSHAQNLIASMVDCCAIETHDSGSPGSHAAVAACFQNSTFDHIRSGEYHVYMRRRINSRSMPVPVIHVLRAPVGIRAINLVNVPPEGWGYYTFDGVSCQLNAAPQEGAPTELTTTIELSGQSIFEAETMVENPMGFGVTFGLSMSDLSSNSPIVSASVNVNAGERHRWFYPVGALTGSFRVSLTTKMAPGSRTKHMVRSYWLDPKFHGGDG